MKMPLSELIRVMRKKALLSQESFAKALNVSVGTINRWENAKTKPNITAMKKIKAFCEENNIPFDEIERTIESGTSCSAVYIK